MARMLAARARYRLTAVGTLLAAVLLALGLSGAPAQARASSFTASVRIPLGITTFVSCADGGAGELVRLTGTLHDLFHITVDDTGGVHVKIHDNPQGVRGFGETTGARYQGTGVTQQTSSQAGDGLPFELTYVNNFRIIATGGAPSLRVHETIHVTVNPAGTVTAEVTHTRITCG